MNEAAYETLVHLLLSGAALSDIAFSVAHSEHSF